VLKIGDFGLSKLIDQATKTLTFKGSGSPRYMAPEVWELARATPATDLYSVGVMLFEALTGKPPFDARDLHFLRDLHLYRPAVRVKSLNPAVPDKLDGIVKKLLLKEAKLRYQTAEAVIEALRDLGTATTPSGDITAIAARVRQHHDAVEGQKLKVEQARDAQRRELEKNRYMEQELVSLIDAVVEEVNAELPEVKIQWAMMGNDRTYRLGNRVLVIHFFRPGELYDSLEVPGRIETLRKRHAVHGGYIEIREGNSDREGWNFVLVRPPDSIYGDWILVETEVSALTGRATRYLPIATQARLFADNLACHWMPAIHVYQLKSKPLEKSDILKIIHKFVPET
jgi:serine/threonine protein kinase